MSTRNLTDATLQKTAQVNTHFSPSAPIDSLALFAGRLQQINTMLNAITQRGQHAILYGERGVGKTSLARIMNEVVSRAQIGRITCCIINCTAQDDYDSIWHKAFRELRFTYTAEKIGLREKTEDKTVTLNDILESISDKDVIGPEDIRYTLQVVQKSFIIIDELDRLHDPTARTLLADTIKTLSDHSVDCTILLVGIADTVDELIQEHASIERALVQVHMPRMTHEEIGELLDKALDAARMSIDLSAKARIAELARGLPHYAHLLGQHSALAAIEDSRDIIDVSDIQAAMRATVAQAQSSIQTLYHTATTSSRKNNLFGKVLLACALAQCDELGYFSAVDVCQPLTKIIGKSATINAFSQHLQDFCDEKRGPVLQRKGQPRGYRYRFINPLIVPFVIIKGYYQGLIADWKYTEKTLFD